MRRDCHQQSLRDEISHQYVLPRNCPQSEHHWALVRVWWLSSISSASATPIPSALGGGPYLCPEGEFTHTLSPGSMHIQGLAAFAQGSLRQGSGLLAKDQRPQSLLCYNDPPAAPSLPGLSLWSCFSPTWTRRTCHCPFMCVAYGLPF